MKRAILVIGAAVWFALGTAFAGTPAADKKAGEKNLIPNGSFEDDFNKQPEKWFYYAATATSVQRGKYIIDAKVAHSGTCCVAAELTPEDCQDGKGYGGWHPADIKVKPNTAYRLRAWIKVKMVPDGKNKDGATRGAWFWIYGMNKEAKETVAIGDGGGVNPETQFFTDVPEWREVVIDFVTGKNIDRFNVWLRLDGAGTAWFDDVSLVEHGGDE